MKSLEKRCLEREMERFQRRQALKKRRILNTGTMTKAYDRNSEGSATVMQQDDEESTEESNEELSEEN